MKRVLLFLGLIFLPFSMLSNVKAANYASDTLKGKVVTSGDGLYVDKYNDGRYVYKGGNPNNFIKFNNELWRIISVEKDGTLKIIKNDSLNNKLQFNDKNDNGTYCSNWYNGGCNAWGKSEYFDGGFVNFVTENHPVNGTVTDDSIINKYLNNDYYNNISNSAKCEIVPKNYYFGRVINNNSDTIVDIINEEKTQVWNGNIGLPNVSDLLLASSDENKCGTIDNINGNRSCYYINPDGEKVSCGPIKIPDDWKQYADNTCSSFNYLMVPGIYEYVSDKNDNYLFINAGSVGNVYEANGLGISGKGEVRDNSRIYNVANKEKKFRPVTYLRSDMEITKGDGSENNPYEFKCDECDGTNNNSKNESNQVVDVPSTSMFISIFIIGGFILITALCIVIYLKVFKKDINK